jgi:hypothetical protein
VTTGNTENEVTLSLHKGYKAAAQAAQKGWVAVEPHATAAKAKFDELYAQVGCGWTLPGATAAAAAGCCC